MKNVIIVGAGLFGCVAAALAQRRGFRVTLIDAERDWAGSKPAACLMKPSWFSGLNKADVKAGLAVLDELYGLETLRFKAGPVNTDVHWVNPKTVLACDGVERLDEDVTFVKDGVALCNDFPRLADAVLVAAGVWSSALVNMPAITSLRGSAFTFDAACPTPSIDVWAPYRQLVAFEREPGKTWVGDGSALKNWTDERETQSFKRAQGRVGADAPLLKIQRGARPYVDGHKAGYFAQVDARTWVSTGGAKNGTIIAAIQAKRFVDAITHSL